MVEEGTHLLRRAPLTTWLLYYAGSVPFVVYLFYFWSDMSRSGLAEDRLLESSLMLAVLYLLMKVSQAWFCDRLLALVEAREESERMPLRGWLRLAASQMWVHATAPWLLFVGLLTLLPLPWIYAFYHNVTVLAVDHFRQGGRTVGLLRKAMQQSHWQLMQQMFMLALLKVAALLVYANLLIGFIMAMQFSKSFTGTDNAFSTTPALFFSTPVQAMLISLCYLVMNPVVKSIYVLRCFYGESRKSGADLAVRLRGLRVAEPALLGIMLVFFFGAMTAPARGEMAAASVALTETAPAPAPAVPGDKLGNSIRDVLQGSEFQWRMPREEMAPGEESSWIGAMMRSFTNWLSASLEDLGKLIGDLLDWLFGNKEDKSGEKDEKFEMEEGGTSMAWVGIMPTLLKILAGALLLALLWVIARYWRQSRKTAVVEAAAAADINLEHEDVVATQLPENEWLRLAREKMASGDLRLALRALFLATLANLGEKRLLQITHTKSNGDYVRELGWRAKGRSELNDSFTHQVRTFDRVWYGWHDVSQDLMNRFEEQHERITSHAT